MTLETLLTERLGEFFVCLRPGPRGAYHLQTLTADVPDRVGDLCRVTGGLREDLRVAGETFRLYWWRVTERD